MTIADPRPARMTGLGAALLALPLLAGCVPNLGPAPEPKPASSYAVAETLSAPERAWPAAGWWKAYEDPQLDALIDEGLATSPDLRVANARLSAALAVVEAAGAKLNPAAAVEGDLVAVKQSRNTGFPEDFKSFIPAGWHVGGTLDARMLYEFDLAGKNRAALAAAASEAEAARVEASAARLTLSTAIASAYADLVRLADERNMAINAVRVRADSLKLVTDRLQQGLDHKGAAATAEAALETAKGNLAGIEGDIALVRNQISALLGSGPDRGARIALPAAPKLKPLGLPANLPAELLARRPDVVAAKRRAEAAADRIKVAKADFYPNVNLNGVIGLQAFEIGDLFQKDSIMGSFGPAIQLPLFAGHRLKGQYKGARADYDTAVAQYDRTVANAFRDVADALAARKALDARGAHARAAADAAETAWNIARARYTGDLSRYSDVLTAEDKLLDARRVAADLDALAFTQDIALVRALGGGFGG